MVLTTQGLTAGVSQGGIFTIRGSYNQGSLKEGGPYTQGFLESGVLTARGLFARVLTTRGFYKQKSYNKGV